VHRQRRELSKAGGRGFGSQPGASGPRKVGLGSASQIPGAAIERRTHRMGGGGAPAAAPRTTTAPGPRAGRDGAANGAGAAVAVLAECPRSLFFQRVAAIHENLKVRLPQAEDTTGADNCGGPYLFLFSVVSSPNGRHSTMLGETGILWNGWPMTRAHVLTGNRKLRTQARSSFGSQPVFSNLSSGDPNHPIFSQQVYAISPNLGFPTKSEFGVSAGQSRSTEKCYRSTEPAAPSALSNTVELSPTTVICL